MDKYSEGTILQRLGILSAVSLLSPPQIWGCGSGILSPLFCGENGDDLSDSADKLGIENQRRFYPDSIQSPEA